MNPRYGQLIMVAPGKSSTVCAHNSRAQHIFVSIADQHAWFCTRTHSVRDTVVTTGASTERHATPLGSWLVQGKQADRVLNGPGYSQHVRYWVPFNGDFGFHDAAWQQMPYGTTGYRTLGSHGCVHLPRAEMTWFYHWVHVGADVTIIK